jgi:hypothetical protein
MGVSVRRLWVEPGPTATGDRAVVPLMRLALLLGGFLVTVAGLQLFVLSTQTDHWFAWTIAAPVTAAFLGGFYWTATPVAVLSALQTEWSKARVAVFGVEVFLLLTLLTTLMHLDKFHLDDPDRVARAAAWLWLAIYVADPLAIGVALFVQLRAPGRDPPRLAELPSWYRSAVAVHAGVTLVVGAMLLLAPAWSGTWWPWPLTPLTARAMASWLIGLGIVLATVVWENDWLRIRPLAIGYVALGVLELAALARFGSDVGWGEAGAWVYVAFLATAIVLGATAVARSRPGRMPGPATTSA